MWGGKGVVRTDHEENVGIGKEENKGVAHRQTSCRQQGEKSHNWCDKKSIIHDGS